MHSDAPGAATPRPSSRWPRRTTTWWSRSPTGSRTPSWPHSTRPDRPSRASGCTRCTRCATARTSTGPTRACATSRTSSPTSPGRASPRVGSTSPRPTSRRCPTSSTTWRPTLWWWPPPRRPTVTAGSRLGTNADYVARLIGKAPFFLEANPNMPRTRGENQVHVSQVAGWVEADYPLPEMPPAKVGEKDRVIGETIAERIPDGATIQVGIGAIPAAAIGALRQPPRPRGPHRAAVRRRGRAVRRRGHHRCREGHPAREDGDDLRHGHQGASTTSSTTTRRSSSCRWTG